VSFLISVLVLTAIAGVFVAIAFHAARRFGWAGVVGAWLASSALLAVGMTLRLRGRPEAVVYASNRNVDPFTPRAFALLSLVAFAAAAVATWRNYRRAARLTRRTVASGIAAFFLGALGCFMILMMTDIIRFLSQ
jgi:hypothetical protein